jgi:ribosomal protein S18 acetylase RimI-like enzyme
MCSASLLDRESEPIRVVDISSLDPRDLEVLWQREAKLWLDELYWDISPVLAIIRRAVERKSLAGKAARAGAAVVGYIYYLLEGHRAVLGSLVLVPRAESSEIGSRVLGSLLASIETDPSVQRIESQFISFGLPWLSEFFRDHGFTEYQRAFMRRSLEATDSEVAADPGFRYELCGPACLSEASRLMQEAHAGSIDAEMNELYRTRDGCRLLLENILHRNGCGEPVSSASFIARDPKNRVSGLVLTTRIAPHHAHLAQVAVGPAMQGKGLGRVLLQRALGVLACTGFRTVSLMVSGANRKAHNLYDSLGFREVLAFPVFSWDQSSQAPRSHGRQAGRPSSRV